MNRFRIQPMRRAITLHMLAIGTSLASLPVAHAQAAPPMHATGQAATPIPIDLPFGLSAPSDVVLSPDGGVMAYAVHSPPEKTGSGAYYLPNGVPTSIPNRTLHLMEVASGKQWKVGPEGANCWRPSFSQDGAWIAFYCDKGNAAHLWVYDLRTRAIRQLGSAIIKPQVWQGDEPQWSPDGKEIFVPLALPRPASIQPDTATDAKPRPTVRVLGSGREAPTERKAGAAGGSDPTISELMREAHTKLAAIDVKTGKSRIVVPAASTPTPNVIETSPSGKWIVYSSVPRAKSPQELVLVQDISIVRAAGGAIVKVAADVPARMGNLRGAYSMHPTKDQIFWVKDGRIWTVDFTTGATSPKPFLPSFEATPAPLLFTGDGSTLVTLLRQAGGAGNTPPVWSSVDLKSGTVKAVPAPEGVSISWFMRKGETAWQPRPDSLMMFGRENATGNTVYALVDLKSNSSRIVWKGTDAPSIIGTSKDGSLVGIHGDRDTPENLYRISPDFSKTERLTNLNPRLEAVKFGPVESFTTAVPRFDGGKDVTSAIALPAGAKRGDKLPAIVIVYPRSMGMPSAAMSDFGGGDAAGVPASIYTTNGYAVLFTQTPIRKPGEPGDHIADILAVIEPQVRHAIELGYIDENRIAVAGHSHGGYATAALLSATGLFKAGIAFAGAYDLPFNVNYMGKGDGYFSELGKIQSYWNMRGNLWEDQKSYIDASPLFRANKIEAPLMIVQGVDDRVTPAEDSRLMFNALRQLGKDALLVEYDNEGHFYDGWSRSNRIDLAERALRFLNKYLGVAKASSR